jgi:hypothetical protein
MSTAVAVKVVQGFSLTNRWLIYASMMLAPAQFISGIASNCPSNLGFLAYSWYTQVQWYKATKAGNLHALSLLPVNFNMIFIFTYLGGLSSGNIPMAIFLGIGTAGLIIINSVTAWISWSTNQTEGFGVYKFFFFGWRTLTPGWHKFILTWQIADSLTAFSCLIASIIIPIAVAARMKREDDKWYTQWWARYSAIPVGAFLVMLFLGWQLILWAELIVNRNHIQSDTDWVAVWLFVAQVAAMLVPSCGINLSCFRGRLKTTSKASGQPVSKV